MWEELRKGNEVVGRIQAHHIHIYIFKGQNKIK